MVSLLRVFKILGFLVAIPIVIYGTLWITATPRGLLAARFDVWRGHYEIKKYGLIRAPLPIYSRILKERYNIKCPEASSCMVTESEIAFKNAYNSVSVPAITNHFGKDVLEECKKAAEDEFQLTRTRDGPACLWVHPPASMEGVRLARRRIATRGFSAPLREDRPQTNDLARRRRVNEE